MESGIRKAEMITKIEKLEMIAEETAKIRRRFFENSKGFYKKTKNGVSWINITGTPDRAAIEVGNNAAHRGNVEVDALLIEMELLNKKKYAPLFKELYTIPLDLYQKLRHKGTKYRELLSLDGTLPSRFSFTPHSHSAPLDQRFAKLYEEAVVLYQRKDLYHASWKNGRPVCMDCEAKQYKKIREFFDADPDIEIMMVEMRKIACQVLEMD
jgi:hypothetical protein